MSRDSLRTPRTRAILHTVVAGLILFAFAADSDVSAQTVWTAGSTINIPANFVVTDTLTIEQGVTVRMAAFTRFTVGASGTLIVQGTPEDPVLFTPMSSVWEGVRFDPGSQGDVTGAIIQRTSRYGVEIIGASPTIRSSVIRDVSLNGFTLNPSVVHSAGIRVHRTSSGQVANPIILGCTIEDVEGVRGGVGLFGDDGPSGGSGGDGQLFSPTGQSGEHGDDGFAGGNGYGGAACYGIYVTGGASATIGYSTTRFIRGGTGGSGGRGGRGGDGGHGGNGYDGLAIGGNGGHGGNGGRGGSAGRGGPGGAADAIRFENASAQAYVFQNVIYGIEPGAGGSGGTRGSGGNGGDAGDGGDCSAPLCLAGHGGNGGNAGSTGVGGSGGEATTMSVVTALNSVVALVNNTVGDIRRGNGGPGGPAGVPGVTGARGVPGTASGSGTNGDFGGNGTPGTGHGPGPVGEPGATRGLIASGSPAQVELFNNIVALNGDGVMLQELSGASVITDYNNFSGYSTLVIGTPMLGANNVTGDPHFLNPGAGDFRLTDISFPVIDTGSNAHLPTDFLDNDNDNDEPIPFDLAGNARVADDDSDGTPIVEMGAYEGITAATFSVFRSEANVWMNTGTSEAHAFDELYPGISEAGGCLLNNATEPLVISLDGGTLIVSAFRGSVPVCSIVDASGAPAVSDALLENVGGDGMVVFEFIPPVTGFYTYFGSLAVGRTATMRLYTIDEGQPDPLLVDSIVTAPSVNAILATGMGFRSLAPIHRVEFTMTKPGAVVVGAFTGLRSGEPSLGTIDIPDYAGPGGSTVQFDFACSFVETQTTCPPDVNGDGEINFTDLNAVLTAFGSACPS